jgi:hypothetical protein
MKGLFNKIFSPKQHKKSGAQKLDQNGGEMAFSDYSIEATKQISQ